MFFIAEAMSSSEDESVEIQTNRWKIDSIKYDVAKSKLYLWLISDPPHMPA